MLSTKPSSPCLIGLRTLAVFSCLALMLLARADVKTTSRMTLTSTFGGQEPKVVSMTSYYKAGKMRVDGSDGNSFIMDSVSKKTISINVKEKTYTEMTMDSITGASSAQRDIVKKIKMKMSGHMKPTNEEMTIAGKPAKKYSLDMVMDALIPAMNGKPSPVSMHL